MDNLPDIISKDPEEVTDAELESLKEATAATRDYLEILQRALQRALQRVHERLTEGRATWQNKD